MFQQLHTTANGQKMLIAQMKDSHLLNMIQVIVRRVEKMTDEFQSIVASSEQGEADAAFNGRAHTEAQRKIYGIPAPPDLEVTTTQYAETVAKASLLIEPYLMEAWTRRFEEQDELTFATLRLRWQQAVGRNEALPNPRGMIAIAAARPGMSATTFAAKYLNGVADKHGIDFVDDDNDEPEQNW